MFVWWSSFQLDMEVFVPTWELWWSKVDNQL